MLLLFGLVVGLWSFVYVSFAMVNIDFVQYGINRGLVGRSVRKSRPFL